MFEAAQRWAEAEELPVELLGRSGRGVSLLEFMSVNEAGSNAEDRTSTAAMGQEEAETNERALQLRAMIDAAREEAISQARREFGEEMEARLEVERSRVDLMRRQFAKDRERYFGRAEEEVVRLALAVARRVLAREVEADPMHLAGAVRAALARVQEGTSTVLRAPACEVKDWSAMFGGAVEVVADEGLIAGECVLETSVGRVELGVEVQIAEIERGFGELLRRQGE